MSRQDELPTLISLFDDSDETVSRCVQERILSMGRGVLDDLAAAAAKAGSPQVQALILSKRRHFSEEFRLADLSALSRNSTNSYFPLYDALATIASLMDADLRREDLDALLLQCSQEISREISPKRTMPENVEIFSHIFFNRLRFSQEDEDFKNPESALMPRTLEKRRGNPVALAMAYFLLADEAELPIFPLTGQGRLVPCCVDKGEELFYVNLAEKGSVFAERPFENAELQGKAALPGIYLEMLRQVCENKGMQAECLLLDRALEAYGCLGRTIL